MRASMNTTTVFLIVVFGMTTFMFFGMNTFLSITYSADVVQKDLEFLDTIDGAHIIEACLEDGSGRINEERLTGFQRSQCLAIAPGFMELDLEYLIEDIEEGAVVARSSGWDPDSAKPRHSISIVIVRSDGESHVGRIHAQAG